MIEILQLSPPHHQHLPCSPSSIPTDYYSNDDGLLHQTGLDHDHTPYNSLFNHPHSYPVQVCSPSQNNTVELEERSRGITEECTSTSSGSRGRKRRERDIHIHNQEGGAGGGGGSSDQVSLLAVFVTVFRKSLVGACRSFDLQDHQQSMEIGVPTNVRHVNHVTFDRFNGFLGLPVEFEPEVPRRPPSASTSVFGVSTESMQLSFDSRGNSVPTILLMMQRRLYSQGGLQAEGIFRINGENGQEEYMREQLNKGEVPEDIDVHCLAGLIKAWFRELPNGLLDSLEPEQVMQAQSEEECARLVRLLPPTEASLMDWAINLMADVAQLEHHNKMNARNVAMVFAPNMTQMDDPLTALMYAVQVMNFLKTLIVKTLRERVDSIIEPGPASDSEPSDENGHQSSSHLTSIEEAVSEINEEEDQVYVAPEITESPSHPHQGGLRIGGIGFLASIENIVQAGKRHLVDHCDQSPGHGLDSGGNEGSGRTAINSSRKTTIQQSSNSNSRKGFRKAIDKPAARGEGTVEKISRGSSIVSRLNSRTERIEAWR